MSVVYQEFVERVGAIHRNVHGDGAKMVQRIVSTCVEMLRDRGCADVAAHPNVEEAVMQNQPIVRGDDPLTLVYLHHEDKIGVKFARSVTEDASTHVVLVSIEGCTPFTRKECDAQRVQFFTARELAFNITRHELVPKHEKMEGPPPGTTLAQLPKLPETDAVARYHAWPVGTVVRVWRVFAGSEPVPYFRVVSPSS